MMTIRKFSIFMITFAFIALVVGLTGCEKAMDMMPGGEMPGGQIPEITIGVAVAETGDNAEPYGLPMLRGLQLAREQLNMHGANITFVREDNMSTVEGAKAAVDSLVKKGVPAIIGVGISDHLEEAFPIAQAAEVVAISPISSAAGLSEIGDYVFRIGLATDILTPIGVSVTKEKLGYDNVALIYDSKDAYSTSSYNEIKKALEANDVSIVPPQDFPTGEIDFSMQLNAIKEYDPDALFIAALSTEMTQIIVQARSADIGITANLIVPDLTNFEAAKAGEAAEGAVSFAGWSALFDTPRNPEFIQAYMTKYDGVEPSPWAAQAYASLYILHDALGRASSMDSAAIRNALAETNVTTILGNFSFDEYGEARYDRIEERVALIVENGKLKILEESSN